MSNMNIEELAHLHQELFGNGKGTVFYGSKATGTKGVDIRNNGAVPYPPEHVPFDEQAAVALPAVGNTTTVLQFAVPIGYEGLITRLSCNFLGGGFSASGSEIAWSLLADNKPIRNFEYMTSEKGTIATPREVEGIRLYSNQVIEFKVTHIANGLLNGDTAVSLGGFYYPVTQ